MVLICQNCGASTYEQLKVTNNGVSPIHVECLVCGEEWVGQQAIMSKGDLPGKKDIPPPDNLDKSPGWL